MQTSSYAIAAILFCVLICGCKKKEDGPETIRLSIPFQAALGKDYILHESAIDSITGVNVKHTITVKFTSIADYRCFESDGWNGCCPSSLGGSADVVLSLSKDNEAAPTKTLFFPGCTRGDEYDTINTNVPKALIDRYQVNLLKLDPWEFKAKNEKEYSAKLVIRKR